MKKRLILFVMGVGLCVQPRAWAATPGEPGDLGLGIMVGAPTGLSAKYWLNSLMAFDGGLGWHFGDDDRLQIHSDFLWHIAVPGLDVPNGRLPFYVGAGLRVLAGDHSEAGVRIPLGASYLFNNTPVEIFAEIVPIVEFAPDTSGELDGAIGVRYYFKTR